MTQLRSRSLASVALPLAASSLVLLLVACSTPRTTRRESPRPRSFSTQVFATVADCCTSCRAIAVSVRNPTDEPVTLDLSRAHFTHNRDRVALTFEGASALVELAPHSTWRGTLRPPAGAPNPASLKEGRFRNGVYRITIAVLQDPKVPTGPIDRAVARLDLDYAARLADLEGHELPEACAMPRGTRFSRSRPTGWPDPVTGAPAD